MIWRLYLGEFSQVSSFCPIFPSSFIWLISIRLTFRIVVINPWWYTPPEDEPLVWWYPNLVHHSIDIRPVLVHLISLAQKQNAAAAIGYYNDAKQHNHNQSNRAKNNTQARFVDKSVDFAIYRTAFMVIILCIWFIVCNIWRRTIVVVTHTTILLQF